MLADLMELRFEEDEEDLTEDEEEYGRGAIDFEEEFTEGTEGVQEAEEAENAGVTEDPEVTEVEEE